MNANKQDAGGLLPDELEAAIQDVADHANSDGDFVSNETERATENLRMKIRAYGEQCRSEALARVTARAGAMLAMPIEAGDLSRNGEQCRAASGWQPAECAPIREAVIVYHRAHWDRLACLREDGVWWPWPRQAGDEHLAYSPTHWHPIPEAPNE